MMFGRKRENFQLKRSQTHREYVEIQMGLHSRYIHYRDAAETGSALYRKTYLLPNGEMREFKYIQVIKKGIFSDQIGCLYSNKEQFKIAKSKGLLDKSLLQNAEYVSMDVEYLYRQIAKIAKEIEEEEKKKSLSLSIESVDVRRIPRELIIKTKRVYEGDRIDPSRWLIIIDTGDATYSYDVGQNGDCRYTWETEEIVFPIRAETDYLKESIELVFLQNGCFHGSSNRLFQQFIESLIVGCQCTFRKQQELNKYELESQKLFLTLGEKATALLEGQCRVYPLGPIFSTMYDSIKRVAEGFITNSDVKLSVPIYETYEVEDHTEAELKEKAGKDGEELVDYVLKWLQPKGFRIIEKNCINKYEKPCILLQNPGYIDEPQEYDAIAIFTGGIINIEVKNYGGKVEISPDGQWTQEKADGMRKGIENPVFQVDRHHAVLSSIIGEDVPIFDIICIANKATEIVGAEYSAVPIVKYDMLQRYLLDKIESKENYHQEDIDKMVDKIEAKKANNIRKVDKD